MKKAYLAGKVSGLPMEEVKNKFAAYEERLAALGYDVTNPVKHIASVSHVSLLDGWADERKHCIKAMLRCDEVHLLPCWQESKGARLERDIALRLGLPIIYH